MSESIIPEESGKKSSDAPAPPNPAATKPGDAVPPENLTPEEQMERFAKEMKENDWGHQPC